MNKKFEKETILLVFEPRFEQLSDQGCGLEGTSSSSSSTDISSSSSSSSSSGYQFEFEFEFESSTN